MDHSTETLSESEIKYLEKVLTDNPKLHHGLAKMLDEKFGFQQGLLNGKLEEISEKLDGITQKLGDHDKRFGTLENNFEILGEKQDLLQKELRKMSDTTDSGGPVRRRPDRSSMR